MGSARLHYRYFGGRGNPPLVLLHGLLGSSRNWVSTAKELVGQFEVFAVDLRNHGESPQVESMAFSAMASDIERFLDEHSLGPVHLLGHSLGGKVAMRFAVDRPSRMASLIVVDIAPRAYPPHHQRDFDAMNALRLDELANRKDAENQLAETVPDWGQRMFLLTNLERQGGGFRWAVNLRALTAERDTMRQSPLAEGEVFRGAATFIIGGQSRFVLPEDWRLILRFFPRARIDVIEEAGHNPHIEKKAEFLAAIARHHRSRACR